MQNSLASINRLSNSVLITIIGLIGYLPIATMYFTFKNDIIALDLPIIHHINNSVANLENPFWIHTWDHGFPLNSIITWSIYSPFRIIFLAFQPYNIYTLHIEFLTYVILAGLSMNYLLKMTYALSKNWRLFFASCYMLSSIVTSSGQWLMAITFIAIAPLVICRLYLFFKNPNLWNSIIIALIYYLHFTSVYPAFTIVTTYLIAGYATYKLTDEKNRNFRLYINLLVTLLFTLALCWTPLQNTLNIMEHIERGSPLSHKSDFFQSNYFSPLSILTLIAPLTFSFIDQPNTSFLFQPIYSGYLLTILLVFLLINFRKSRNILFYLSILMIVVAMGNNTPVRNFLNILPGFNLFRNVGFIRLYAVLFIIIWASEQASKGRFQLDQFDSFKVKKIGKALSVISIIAFTALAIYLLALSLTNFISEEALYERMKSLRMQLCIDLLFLFGSLAIIGIALKLNKLNIAIYGSIVILILQANFMHPYFSISSHTPHHLASIYSFRTSIYDQKEDPKYVKTLKSDQYGIKWQNLNVYRNLVSLGNNSTGPLHLKAKNENAFLKFADSLAYIGGFIYASKDASVEYTTNSYSTIFLNAKSNRRVNLVFFQHNYPGWYLKVNGKIKEFDRNIINYLAVTLNPGNHRISLKYNKVSDWLGLAPLPITIIFLVVGIAKRKNWSN
jgi:hypothetical protein